MDPELMCCLSLPSKSLLVFLDSCTQWSTPIPLSFWRCRYIVYINIHVVLSHFRTLSQQFLFSTYIFLCSREYNEYPHWLPDTLLKCVGRLIFHALCFLYIWKEKDSFTHALIALVFFVTLPVRYSISENVIRWAGIAIIVSIIDILIIPQ